jgi:hypothetical protein
MQKSRLKTIKQNNKAVPFKKGRLFIVPKTVPTDLARQEPWKI